ncbi:MAG: SDR family oxidoreductase [Cyanobacteria bacterium SBLK]|nr:SDR family oxidoreductase [Cyanobacteria bacterium SBLK]
MENELELVNLTSTNVSEIYSAPSPQPQNSQREFDGKVVLVTGGSSGIGRATAIAFGRAGAKVVVASRRVTEGEETVHQIETEEGEGIFIATDVSKDSDVKTTIEKTIATYGRLDCAFNNAGVIIANALSNFSEEDWDCVLDINLKGIWLSLKYEIPAMLKQGKGTVVNMASIAGMIGIAGNAVYSASKGGVIALTRTAAVEYANSGIRINCISPGVTQTQILDDLPSDALNGFINNHPVKRAGQPEEIANTVLWLCSHKSAFMTGHNLVIDGGYTAQ